VHLRCGKWMRLRSDEQKKIRLARQSLDPGSEGVPSVCPPDRDPYLLYEDQESAGPDRGAVKPARRPQVVGRQDDQERVREQRCPDWHSVDHGQGPTRDRRNQEGNGGDKDQAFVR